MSKIKALYKRFYDFFENNYYITCIKKGISILLPVLVIGIIASIIRYFPALPYQNFMEHTLNGAMGKFFDIFVDISLGYFSLYALIAISYFVIEGKTNNFPVVLMSIITSVFCLFILTDATVGSYNFGLKNIFLALALGCLVPTVIYKLMQKPKEFDPTYVKTNQQVYKDMIKLTFPIILLIGGAFLIRMLVFVVLKCESVNGAIGLPFIKLISLINLELPKGIFYQLVAQLMWMFGLDGNDALKGISFNGNIINANFISVFVLSTAIYGLLIAIIVFSKNKKNRVYAAFGSIPAVFNQHKVLYIGLPVILMPILVVPFVLSAILITIITYLAVYLNIMPGAINTVYESMPIFLNGYFATKSFMAVLVQFVCVLVSFGIYIPFVKLHNEIARNAFKENVRKLLNDFEKVRGERPNATIFNFHYNLGEIAKMLAINLVHDMHDGKIETYFQPIVNNKKAYVGMECLMRWTYEDNIVPPPLALEVAKECNMFYELNYYLWDKMCEHVAQNRTKAFITFNVSVDCLEQDDFVDRLLAIFANHNLEPNGFVIEITEETVLNHQFEILEKITHLKEAGFQFAIDDYGAGQTSMKYFQTNAFELVKIDGDLVKNAEKNPQNYDIIKSMKDFGKKSKFENINFRVLCEFIETEEQFEKFNSLYVDYYQGYLFGKAMPYDEAIKLINVRKQQNV